MTPEPTPRIPTVLVLCTGNSCRSQMAEALLSGALGDRVRVLSAGTSPQPAVAAHALVALQDLGLPTANLRPKDISTVMDREIDLVVTVCDNAQESCPVFPRQTGRLHMSFPDPHGQSIEAFIRVRDAIDQRLVPAVRDALGLKD